MSCIDLHKKAKLDIEFFKENFEIIGIQDSFGFGNSLLLGNCKECKTTISYKLGETKCHLNQEKLSK